MKFAPNRMYVEAYYKCANCGLLLYDKPVQKEPEFLRRAGGIYCSQWCIDWESERDQRKAASAMASA